MKKLVCSMFLAFSLANSAFAMFAGAGAAGAFVAAEVAGAPAEQVLCTVSVNSEDYIAGIANLYGNHAAIQNDPAMLSPVLPLRMGMDIHAFWDLAVNQAPRGFRISAYRGQEANKFAILLTPPAAINFEGYTHVPADSFFKALSGGRIEINGLPAHCPDFTISTDELTQILDKLYPEELRISHPGDVFEHGAVALRVKTHF